MALNKFCSVTYLCLSFLFCKNLGENTWLTVLFYGLGDAVRLLAWVLVLNSYLGIYNSVR